MKYDWGESDNTMFDFEVDGPEISGMAGFGADKDGDGGTIWDGKIAGNRISFMTKSQVTMGFNQPSAEEEHYYNGIVEGDTIHFTMVTDSPYPHIPIHFTAHKVKAGALGQK